MLCSLCRCVTDLLVLGGLVSQAEVADDQQLHLIPTPLPLPQKVMLRVSGGHADSCVTPPPPPHIQRGPEDATSQREYAAQPLVSNPPPQLSRRLLSHDSQ